MNAARYNKIRFFTLVELAVSLAVFAVIALVMIQFFMTSQKTWSQTDSQRETFENARIALDIITRDLESAYYSNGVAPFWHWDSAISDDSVYPPLKNLPSSWGQYRRELIAFVSDSPFPPNEGCTSNLCEIKYQLYYTDDKDNENFGWIRRSVTGNKKTSGSSYIDDPHWNFFNNFVVGYTTNNSNSAYAAFTANSNSSADYQKLIPNVIDLSFTCDTDTDTGRVIEPDYTASAAADACTVSQFPGVVIVSLTLLDSNSWKKWLELQGTSVYPQSETNEAKAFRYSNQRTFSRMVFISDRGQ